GITGVSTRMSPPKPWMRRTRPLSRRCRTLGAVGQPANGRRGAMSVGHGPKDMVWVPGGDFLMGSSDFYPEERPVHRVAVDGFWMDEHPGTVADFRRFVKAPAHVTWAELAPDPRDYPDADQELMVPGSLVFHPTSGPVDLSDYRNWWSWIPGAEWRHPEGPESTLHGRERHPV